MEVNGKYDQMVRRRPLRGSLAIILKSDAHQKPETGR